MPASTLMTHSVHIASVIIKVGFSTRLTCQNVICSRCYSDLVDSYVADIDLNYSIRRLHLHSKS